MSVIGFDIGNENCVIAVAKRGGIDVLLNNEAKRETPSVVSFGNKRRFLGSAGAAFASSNPKSTITQIKRLVGRLFNEPSVQEELKLLPFGTREGPRGGIMIELDYMNKKWIFSPVEILGMLFTHLKQVAEKNLESPVVDCVIGIPSYFTDLQRREYLDAARMAGLVPLRLIHDGTAIALGYGMYKTDLLKSQPTVVVFVDIGHCDTQVTVAAFEQGGMRVLSQSFDPNLGGRDFDEVLFRHFAAQFKEKYKIDVYSYPRASIRLRASCEKVKKVLSANAEAPISIECLIGDTDVRGLITRDEFERLSMELLERVTYPCIMAVEDSGIDADKIYTIELVGSGSRVPAIMKRLTALFNKEPTRTLNASECVARGCALRCAMLSPSLIVRDYMVQDIFPYSIGIPLDKLKNKSHTLFPKGSRIPSYKMIKDTGITKAYVHVSYTNNEVFPAGISHKVGCFSVGSSETSGPEKPRMEITLKLNDYGIVVIDSAIICEDKNFACRTFQSYEENFVGPSQTLNLEFSENLDVATTVGELQEARKREQMLAEQDKKVEETKDQKDTLESFVYDTRSKLASAYRNFASDPEKKVITDSLQETEDWLYEDSDDDSEQDYTGKLHDLKKLLDPIEKRFKEEKTLIQVKTALQTCAEKYCVYAADSLPPSLKKKILIECSRVEQWLNDLSPQQPHLTQIHLIEGAIQTFQRYCKEIIRSKRKAVEHDEFVKQNQIDQPLEPNQSLNQSVDTDSDQNSQLVDSDQTSQPADSDQKVQPADLILKGETVELSRKGKPADFAQKGHLTNSSQNDQLTDSAQTVPPVVSARKGQSANSAWNVQPGDSTKKGQPRKLTQIGQPGDLTQKGQHGDLSQEGHAMDSARNCHHTDSEQKGQPTDSVQKYQPADSYQGDHAADSNQMGPLVNSDKRDKHEDSDQSDKHEDSDQRDKNGDSDQIGGDSNQGNQVADSNVDSVQKDKHEDSDPSVKHEDPDQRANNVDSYEMGGDSNKGNQVADSNQMCPTVDSDQKDKYKDSDQRDKNEDSDQRDKNVDSDQMGVDSNQMGPPLDLDQRDKHEDSDQKETNPKTRTKETKTCTRTKETVDSAPKDQLGDMQLC